MFLHSLRLTSIFAAIVLANAHSGIALAAGPAPAVVSGVGGTWTNPETGISIPIPAGWTYSGNPEQPFFFNSHYQAMLICEPQTVQYSDLQDYAGALGFTMGQDFELAGFIAGTDKDTLVSHGKGKTAKHLSTALAPAGARFCTINYLADETGQKAEFTDPALNRALFASVGEIGMPVPAPASTWTNPDTGITVTIPAGWIYQPGEGTMVFRQGAHFAWPGCNWAIPEGVNSLSDYATTFGESMAGNFDMSPFHPSTTDASLISNGIDRSTNGPATLVVNKAGALYCRILYGKYGRTDVENLNDPALSAVLFESMKQ